MLIGHIGDAHLGFRAYSRTTPGGMNQREYDVVMAFRRAIDVMIERKVDLVVYPGDLFDAPKPSMAIMAEAQRQMHRLHAQTGAAQVLVGGNHDHPRERQAGHPFWPLTQFIPETHVVLDNPEVVTVKLPSGQEAVVVGLPHGVYRPEKMLESAKLADEKSRVAFRILAVHAPIEVRGEDRLMYAKMSKESIPAEILKPARWTYVAAGDFHEFLEFAPNACYSGALERVNAGPWEADDAPDKGFVIYDTVRKLIEHVQVGARPAFDLPPIEVADDMTSEALMAEIMRGVADLPGDDSRIIRQRVVGPSRELWAALDWATIKEVRQHELHYHLQPVPKQAAPKEDADGTMPGTDGETHDDGSPRLTLEGEVEAYVDTHWEPGGGLDRERVKKRAKHYLSQEES